MNTQHFFPADTAVSERIGKTNFPGSAILCAVIIAILPFLIHEIYSYDVWWQVTIGSDILNSGHIPEIDRYTAAASGRPYHDSHWLFQVILALSHRVGGMVGVQLVMVCIWGLILFFCFQAIRQWVTISLAAFLLFIIAMASVERFLPRPELVTFLGIASFYWMLQNDNYRSWRKYAVFGILQVVWSNSHGLFVIGPFMVGCYWFFAATRKLRGRESDLMSVTILLCVVLVSTFITPHGWDGWRYARLLFSEAGGKGAAVIQELGELSPTFGSAARSGIAFWFFITLLITAGSGFLLEVYRRKVSPRMLIVIAMFLSALTGRRNAVLFALVAAPFTAESLALLIPERWKIRWRWVLLSTCLLLVWVWFPLSGNYYLMMKHPGRMGLGVTPSFFPHDLPTFLRKINFKGQVLNSNILGGFYLYHFFPGSVPLTDGRWEIYDYKVLKSIRFVTGQGRSWHGLIDRYQIRGILLAHGSPEAKNMVPSLDKSRDWRLVYLDHAASFWMPIDTPKLPAAVDLSSPDSVPSCARIDDALILAPFLSWMGAKEALALHLERSLSFHRKKEWFLERLGHVQLELKRWVEARKSFGKLIRIDPKNTNALNELAFLAYRQGNFVKALRLIQKTLEIEPENKSYRVNLRRIENAMRNTAKEKGLF